MSWEFDLGSPDGFMFNMSVGYNFEGITSEKIDSFIEGLKNASATPIWEECRAWAKANISRFTKVDVKYIGFEIPDEFVLGYGLDYKQEYRNIPYIAVMGEPVE